MMYMMKKNEGWNIKGKWNTWYKTSAPMNREDTVSFVLYNIYIDKT